MIFCLTLALVGLIVSSALPIEHDETYLLEQALENPYLVGGDMLISHEPHGHILGNAIANEDYRWPGYPLGANIPFSIDNGLALVGLIVSSALPIEHHGIYMLEHGSVNPHLVGGDMLISHIPHGHILGNAIANEDYRWSGYPGGANIPYVIDPSLREQKPVIEKAMKQYQDNTCVRFIPRTNENEYVELYKGVGCYAIIGRNSTFHQPLPLSLGNGCHDIGTILHELGHVLGIYHEQNRSDRDDYLIIHLENVKRGEESSFLKLKPNENILYNDFDYDSIMIYSNYAFSKRPNELKTMEAKNGQELIAAYKKTQLTASDILRVNKMYKCPGYES